MKPLSKVVAGVALALFLVAFTPGAASVAEACGSCHHQCWSSCHHYDGCGHHCATYHTHCHYHDTCWSSCCHTDCHHNLCCNPCQNHWGCHFHDSRW